MSDEYTQVTFYLTPVSVSALEDAAKIDKLSETDVLNRALQVYRYLLMEKQLGKKLVWYDEEAESAEMRLVGFDFK